MANSLFVLCVQPQHWWATEKRSQCHDQNFHGSGNGRTGQRSGNDLTRRQVLDCDVREVLIGSKSVTVSVFIHRHTRPRTAISMLRHLCPGPTALCSVLTHKNFTRAVSLTAVFGSLVRGSFRTANNSGCAVRCTRKRFMQLQHDHKMNFLTFYGPSNS